MVWVPTAVLPFRKRLFSENWWTELAVLALDLDNEKKEELFVLLSLDYNSISLLLRSNVARDKRSSGSSPMDSVGWTG